MLRHPLLDQLTGGTVLVKPEPLQRTGSFKLRGAMNAALLMDPGGAARRHRHPFSSGNHGQATAGGGAALGMPAVIAMPSDAPAIKVESTRRWGAEVVFFDRRSTDRSAGGAAGGRARRDRHPAVRPSAMSSPARAAWRSSWSRMPERRG